MSSRGDGGLQRASRLARLCAHHRHKLAKGGVCGRRGQSVASSVRDQARVKNGILTRLISNRETKARRRASSGPRKLSETRRGARAHRIRPEPAQSIDHIAQAVGTRQPPGPTGCELRAAKFEMQ